MTEDTNPTQDSKKEEPPKPPEYCYDCLKTKGFAISMILISIGTIFGSMILFPSLYGNIPNPIELVIFIIIWFFVCGLILLLAILAVYSIRQYCNKNSGEYRQSWVAGVFSTLVVSVVILIMLVINELPKAYAVIVQHRPDVVFDSWGWVGGCIGFILGTILTIGIWQVTKTPVSDTRTD